MSYLQRKISLIVFDDKSVFLYCLYYISKKEKKRKKKLRISISKFAIRRIKVAGNKRCKGRRSGGYVALLAFLGHLHKRTLRGNRFYTNSR